ncbi:unnamed protein product [Adineta ricciae]|uniref:Uncharacterized protein n=1 Tax=Adineta ricciae TaxID=249248 RepID=A0A815Q2K4_ADIRI|nr:unnamed protein product [Adineta ricciae]
MLLEYDIRSTFWILFLLITKVFCRPLMQRIVVDRHEWEVPSEPEWEEIVKEATAAQQRVFRSCRTTSECRQIVAEFSAIFDRYPKFKHFYETHKVENSTWIYISKKRFQIRIALVGVCDMLGQINRKHERKCHAPENSSCTVHRHQTLLIPHASHTFDFDVTR